MVHGLSIFHLIVLVVQLMSIALPFLQIAHARHARVLISAIVGVTLVLFLVVLLSILKTCETPRPNLFFIDLALPNVDGFEVIRWFKGNPATQHIPIVVISRRGDTVTRLKARLAGVAAFLEKPFHPQDVLTVVQSLATSTNPIIPKND